MKRRYFLRLRDRYTRRGKSFVYIDESGFEAETVRRYAWSLKGQKVYGLRSGPRAPEHPCSQHAWGRFLKPPFYSKEHATRISLICGLKITWRSISMKIMLLSWTMQLSTNQQKPKS